MVMRSGSYHGKDNSSRGRAASDYVEEEEREEMLGTASATWPLLTVLLRVAAERAC